MTVKVTRPQVNTANAGPDQALCDVDQSTLAAVDPPVGSGSWSVVSGQATVVNPSNPASAVTGLGVGQAILRWTVDAGLCGGAHDDVVISRSLTPSDPAAGPSSQVCAANATLAAEAPAIGSGVWSVVSGSANFGNSASPTSTASGLSVGPNVLRWTVSNGACQPKHADVTITRGTPPSTASTSPDKHVCGFSTTVSGNNPSSGTGTWSVVSGNAEFSNAAATSPTVSQLAVGENVLRWTVATDFCGSTNDDVALDVYEAPTEAFAGSDQNLPPQQLHATLSANAATVGTGLWTVIEGNGIFDDPTDPGTLVTDLSLGLNVFRWTITNGPCSSFSEVAIIRPMTCTGNFNVATPADVKTLRVCLSITGNLTVSSVANLQNFSWMVNLESIGGNFQVNSNSSLQDFSGLHNLATIGGFLIVYSNNAMTSLSGLEGLSTVGQQVEIRQLNQLQNLDGLASLTSVGTGPTHHLVIRQNNQLQNIDGLSSLTNVSGDIWVGHNPALTSAEGLSALLLVGRDLRIDDNNALSILGLDSIDQVGRDLLVAHNPQLPQCDALALAGQLAPNVGGATVLFANQSSEGCDPLLAGPSACVRDFFVQTRSDLTSLSLCSTVTGNVTISPSSVPAAQRPNSLTALSNLTSVSGTLYLDTWSEITTLAGLEALASVGALDLYQLNNLESAAALSALTTVTGLFRVRYCHRLRLDNGEFPALETIGGAFTWTNQSNATNYPVTVDAFPALTSIGGAMNFSSSNTNVIKGFPNLMSVQGAITFSSLSRVAEISGFPSLTTQATGAFSVTNNPQLVTFSGFTSLVAVPTSLQINSNNALVSISGFSSLTTVGQNLLINDNPTLQSIVGFNVLSQTGTTISHQLSIVNNPQLSTVSGFGNLQNINGSLLIRLNHALPSTAFLGALEKVTSVMRIEENSALQALGLSALGTTAGSGVLGIFTIFGNPALPQCDAIALRDQILNGPGSITGPITIFENQFDEGCPGAVPPVANCNTNHTITSAVNLLALATCTTTQSITITNTTVTNLAGLELLTQINGNLTISNNVNLTSINNVASLTYISGSLTISNNAQLANPSLPVLHTVGSAMTISSNPQITGVSFPSLVNVGTVVASGGALNIQSNAALVDLHGFSALTSIGGALYLYNNGNLLNISGLSNLTNFGSTQNHYLMIDSNSKLVNLDGLQGLTSVKGYLYIYNNAALNSLVGLDNIQTVGQYVYIYNNNVLPNLQGLESLTSIGHYLYIYTNNILQTLSGLDGLTEVKGYVQIRGNGQLQNLDGLDALETIGMAPPSANNNYLLIWQNGQLKNANGLAGLTHVGGYAHIHTNNQLQSLVGLGGLQSVGNYFRVEANPLLSTLSLDSLTSVGNNFIIFNNPQLPECLAYQYADAIGAGIAGVITIGSNNLVATCD